MECKKKQTDLTICHVNNVIALKEGKKKRKKKNKKTKNPTTFEPGIEWYFSKQREKEP